MEPLLVPAMLRRLSMAGLMLVHIQFAAFLIGAFGLGAILELFGILIPSRPHFDRAARGLARFCVLIYGSGAVLAIIFILVIALFWPTAWYSLFRTAFWPMTMEAVTFVLTIIFLFPWYYTWSTLTNFKWVHLSLGVGLVMAAQLQQSMVDVMAAYMLTPTPPQDFLRVFFNATAIPLDMHRIVGDISFAGFVVAGYAAVKMMRTRDAEQRFYYDWLGNLSLIAGLAFLFLQPAVGLAYMEEIRANTPGGFARMMRGPLAWTWLVQVAFLSALFFLSMLYMTYQVKKSGHQSARLLRRLAIVIGLAALLLVQPYVIGFDLYYYAFNWVNPIGSMQPWKYIALATMSVASVWALVTYLGSLRRGLSWGYLGPGGRGAQRALLALAIIASVMMLWMGFIRENGRSPYLIYYQLRQDQPEQYPALPTTPTPSSSSSSNSARTSASNLDSGGEGP